MAHPHTLPLLLFCFIFLNHVHLPINGFPTFGFTIHHRFSDPVKQLLDAGAGEHLPEKGTVGYITALAHRDLAYHGHRLSHTTGNHSPVTFSSGNSSYRIAIFGSLHYANVTVGSPGSSFMVALDTGSDLFWIPCDCESCVKAVRFTSYEIDFNIYSLSTSSTGKKVPCDSTLCRHRTSCAASPSICPYQVIYLSANTSSSGYLVEDVLHLVADDNPLKPVDGKVSFGCGKVQTGSFLDGGAPNGLLGLGLDTISVPTMLASQNITADSFSMCFGDDGMGRITFGDKGSKGQGETPFNLRSLNPHYNISMTQIMVGSNISHVDKFYAIFDSGTSFTYLNDPIYTLIAENFDSMVKDSRQKSDLGIPFEYCYELSSSPSSLNVPHVNLTMQGGDHFYVKDPTVPIPNQDGDVYCLGILKSDDVNIIGQNFMTGYRVIFDRERMILGWKPSDCNEALDSSMLPIGPKSSTPDPPVSSIDPEAASRNASHISGVSSRHDLFHLHAWTCTLVFIFLKVSLIL